MQETTVSDHVELIREVFLYANRFSGKRFVVQIGSGIVEDPRFPSLVKDLAILHKSGIHLVLVPAAGVRIDEILEKFGVESLRVKGIRITSDEAMPLVKMAAFDVANMVMTQLTGVHIDALIGNWVKARALGVRDGIDYLNAGLVAGVSTKLLNQVLAENHMPILPCIGWSSTGKPYNISSIELSVALAEALRAEKLFFLTDSIEYTSPSLNLPSEGFTVKEGRITRLSAKAAASLADLNPSIADTVAAEMLRAGGRAASSGVERVHILNGRVDGAILKEVFSTLGQGTMISVDEFEAIRPMKITDIPDVLRIMEPNIRAGILIRRDESDLLEQFEDYDIFETDGTVRGCCALHPYGEDQAELAGLAVDPNYGHLGAGAKLTNFAIAQAKEKGYSQIFLLTTQTADYFESLGFKQAELKDLPKEKQEKVNPARKSRVYILNLVPR